MRDRPGNTKEIESWDRVISELLEKGLITHRRQLDELRIWQGSDFNVDNELIRYREKNRDPLFKLLSSIRLLKPLVAQRHSYQTGTLRYFKRCYLDSSDNLKNLFCSAAESDGLISYWVDDDKPKSVPSLTAKRFTKDGIDEIIKDTIEVNFLSKLAKYKLG